MHHISYVQFDFVKLKAIMSNMFQEYICVYIYAYRACVTYICQRKHLCDRILFLKDRSMIKGQFTWDEGERQNEGGINSC